MPTANPPFHVSAVRYFCWMTDNYRKMTEFGLSRRAELDGQAARRARELAAGSRNRDGLLIEAALIPTNVLRGLTAQGS